MVDWAMMTDPATGRVGLFKQNGSSGSQEDPNSTRNLPLNNPATYLADILGFHTDLDLMEVLDAGTKSITHPAVTGLGAGASGFAAKYATNAGSDDQQLVDLSGYSLSEAPFAIVVALGVVGSPGMPVVTNSDGGAWYATAYSRAGEIRIGAKATIGASNLSATAVTYAWLVFKKPPSPTGSILIDFDPSTGITQAGLGKFSSDRPYLQVVSGGSPFDLSLAPTIDLNNGAPKDFRADGTSYAPVPSTLKSYLPFTTYAGSELGGETTGASMGYGGSGSAPTTVQVQAP